MGRAVMVGRGPTGTRLFFLSTVIILTARSSRAQQGDGCGLSVLGPCSGSLSSLGYPGTYPNHTVCEWEISVPQGRRLHFRFADLDIEENNCQVNYLRIYDGIGPHRTQIVKFCGLGLNVPDLILSSGNQVTVQFMSGTHQSGRGFSLAYSTTEHADLITCLDKGIHFTEAEFTRYCPAGCLTSVGEISGTIPHGYRDSSPVCLAAIHAGVVSNSVGGQISVVNSKGIPHYDGSLANNVSSTVGPLSNSLFTFKTSGCYGTLGLESGIVRDSQLFASSVWEWSDVIGKPSEWGPTGARLNGAGLPWASAHSNQQQWLQVDLKKEKRITGITTTGSSLLEYQFYVSAYRVLYSNDGQHWNIYREADATQDKIFKGNTNYLQEVRNNFIPPIEARYVRISPTQWHQRIALKFELLGCQFHQARPRIYHPARPPPPSVATDTPPMYGQTTHTPDIRNTTMPPCTINDMAFATMLVPVLVMILTTLILTTVCAWHWKNRKNSSEGAYDLSHWDRTGKHNTLSMCVCVCLDVYCVCLCPDWWKSMKQFLPSKMAEGEESVRYSSSEVGRLRVRGNTPRLRAEPAEYAQPLVSGVMTSLGQRSTFKPEEGSDPGYTDPNLYDAPMATDIYHAYAQPLPASGAEYATPIMIDIASHLSGSSTLNQPTTVSSFMGRGPASLLTRTDSGQSGRSMYDTPKNTGQATPTKDLAYQVPQKPVE
ncbi:discoidin, CUB and LCCL domain-containing protein 2 isoform X1 [Oncorhynchus mykiss]|nr:discoidin, CUB and LCCL domain-containing protein 2 isoform X1 [Oncorhynchus mykiss]XP_036830964.1 discoidin, CUB and LCCL domain-containing protein 2 isoform X1 [Oncorhynchus mykiss]